jgi:RNA-dependent RNA polymerase
MAISTMSSSINQYSPRKLANQAVTQLRSQDYSMMVKMIVQSRMSPISLWNTSTVMSVPFGVSVCSQLTEKQRLGFISTNWLRIADQSEKGIFDEKCLKLADLHSAAVDYQKHGTPVDLKDIPQPEERGEPDWNEPEIGSSNKSYYQSQRAIGFLYRDIDLGEGIDIKKHAREQRQKLTRDYDPAFLAFSERAAYQLTDSISTVLKLSIEDRVDLDVMEDEYTYVQRVFRSYKEKLKEICQNYTLSGHRGALTTEEEIVLGTVLARAVQPKHRSNLIGKIRERTAENVNATRADLQGAKGRERSDWRTRWLAKSWFAWEMSQYCASKQMFGAKSFGIIALVSVFEALEELEAGSSFT